MKKGKTTLSANNCMSKKYRIDFTMDGKVRGDTELLIVLSRKANVDPDSEIKISGSPLCG